MLYAGVADIFSTHTKRKAIHEISFIFSRDMFTAVTVPIEANLSIQQLHVFLVGISKHFLGLTFNAQFL